MSGPPRAYPDRAVVERVIREEALAAGAAFEDVLGNSNKVKAKLARTRAAHRIMQETGCSHRGLEEVWGSSLRKLARRKYQGGFDQATTERLRWRYGDARAAQIIAGQDPAANRDLAAWRRLCAKGRAVA